MTCVTGAGSYQGRQSHGRDASLCVLSNLFSARHGCSRTRKVLAAIIGQQQDTPRDGACVVAGPHLGTKSDLLAHIAAAAAARSRRVATALAEQTAAAVVIFPGCLFA